MTTFYFSFLFCFALAHSDSDFYGITELQFTQTAKRFEFVSYAFYLIPSDWMQIAGKLNCQCAFVRGFYVTVPLTVFIIYLRKYIFNPEYFTILRKYISVVFVQFVYTSVSITHYFFFSGLLKSTSGAYCPQLSSSYVNTTFPLFT